MHGFSVIVAAVVAVLLTGSASANTAPGVGEITISGHTDRSDQEAVGWAQNRFAEAGLPLPDVQVRFHVESDPCQGSRGGYTIEDGTHVVLICNAELGPARELQVKRTLLHEFAHVWDHDELTDEIRDEFMRFRGSNGWLSGVPYDERAGEHAAEVITWGLMDQPFLMGSLDEPWSQDDLSDGYRMLTGVERPHGYVWSFFAAAHNVYAHTSEQLKTVRAVWEQAEAMGLADEPTEIRFHRDIGPCRGELVRAELGSDERLRIRICPGDGELYVGRLEAILGVQGH